MSTTVKIVLAVIAVIAIVALAVWLIGLSGGGAPADPLAGSKWQVRSYYNPAVAGGMASPLAGTQLTAEFAGAQVAGSSGCNNYSASYTVSGSSLTIGPAASTMKACAEPPGVMEQEAAFLTALQSARSFELQTGQLHILNDKGQVVVDCVPYTPAPTAIPPVVTTAAPTNTSMPAAPTATATSSPTPVPGAPVISRFTAEPPGQIPLGQCVALAWEVQGQVSSVTLTANNKVLMSPAPAVGTTSDCPSRAQPVTYIVEAKGPGGTTRQTQTVNVVEAPTATPVPPTATPEPAVIDSFNVNPSQLKIGECVNLSWSASGGVASSLILRNGAVINENAGLSGQQQDCPEAVGGYTYALEVQGAGGQRVTQQQAVTVAEASPQNPLAGTRWQVQSLSDPATGSAGVVVPGTTLTMAFGADGNVSGSSGCNTYTSAYQVSGSQLTMTAPVGTKLLCTEPAGILEQEAGFLALLPTVGGYAINGSNLTLRTAAGKAVMELSAY